MDMNEKIKFWTERLNEGRWDYGKPGNDYCALGALTQLTQSTNNSRTAPRLWTSLRQRLARVVHRIADKIDSGSGYELYGCDDY